MKINVFDPSGFEPRGNCHVATAVIGGVASVGSALIGSSAAKSAADAQASAANNATNAQMAMFNTAKGELQPYINAGTNMMPSLQGWIDPNSSTSPLATLLKLTTPGADMTSTLSQTPGFQFTKNIGTQATENALAARGLAGPGGPLGRALADYSGGLASNTWQNVVQQLLNTFSAGATPMQNLINTGAGAAGTLTGAATNVGGQIGSNIIGAGNAQAAGTIGQANAFSGLLNNMGGYGMMANLGGLFNKNSMPATQAWNNSGFTMPTDI